MNDDAQEVQDVTENSRRLSDLTPEKQQAIIELIRAKIPSEVIEGINATIGRAHETLGYIGHAVSYQLLTNSETRDFLEAMQVIGTALKTIKNSLDSFYQSEQWGAIRREFPDISDEEGASLFFLGISDLVVNLLPELKTEITGYETANHCKVSFSDLLNAKDPETATATGFPEELPVLDSFQELRDFQELREAAELPETLLEALMKEAAKKKEIAGALKDGGGLSPKHYTPNHPLANELPGLLSIGHPVNLPVRKENLKTHRKEVTIYAGVSLDPAKLEDAPIKGGTSYSISQDNGEIVIYGDYSEYDRSVGEAVYTIYKRGARAFTAAMVYKEMNHTNSEPSPQQKGSITKSIEKHRRLFVDVDASNEMKMRGVKDETGKTLNYIINDHILNLRVHNLNDSKGNNYKGYEFLSYPCILQFAEKTGQLISYRSDLLDIKQVIDGKLTDSSIANTESRTALKSYIIRRIMQMKYTVKKAGEALAKYEARREKSKKPKTMPDKGISDFLPFENVNRILFETIFSETGQETSNRELQRRNREYCFQVLDFLKARGEIKGYRKVTKGRTIRGVDIDL